MARHDRLWWSALVVAIIAGLALPAGAAVVIDTLSGFDYNVNSYGEGSSLTYGQTLTVPPANILDSFTFKLRQGGGNPTTIRFFVMEWAGNTVTGPVLFQTGPVSLLSDTQFYHDYTVTTGGLPLTSGNQYGLFFTSFLDLDGNNDASFAAGHLNNDPYPGGRFVYNNGAASFAALANPGGWNTIFLGPGDLAFRAEFSKAPEASAFAIVLLTGLSAAACSRKIRSCLAGETKTTSVQSVI